MCSVRDVCKLLKSVEGVNLIWDGALHWFDKNDDVQMAAFGDYAVKELEVCKTNEIGLTVVVTPLKVNRDLCIP